MTAVREQEDLAAVARNFVEQLRAGQFDGCLCEKLSELSLPMLEEVLSCLGIKVGRSVSNGDR